jgi:hypothetical protein
MARDITISDACNISAFQGFAKTTDAPQRGASEVKNYQGYFIVR